MNWDKTLVFHAKHEIELLPFEGELIYLHSTNEKMISLITVTVKLLFHVELFMCDALVW